MAKRLRKLIENLQSEQVPVAMKSTGIIPHRPEISYRDELRARQAEAPPQAPPSSTSSTNGGLVIANG